MKKERTKKEKFNNASLTNGSFLGKKKYIIYKKISSGGYGSVYLAKDDKDRFCAIKEFLPTSFNLRPDENNPVLSFVSSKEEEKFKKNLYDFYFEAEVVSHFNHPNIIKIVDIFEENNTAYLVMPLEKGMSLFHYAHFYLQETGQRITDAYLKDIFIQICDGIGFLHSKNYLHLDIKPGNIWLRPNGHVIILDMGSSRNLLTINEKSNPAFTAGYAPPEQYDKTQKIDQKTDIYAIGGVLKFCLETTPPEMSLNRNEFDSSYYSERVSQTNSHFLRIIDKCMNLNSFQRYSTVQELKADFENIKFLRNNCEYKDYSRNILKYQPIISINKIKNYNLNEIFKNKIKRIF